MASEGAPDYGLLDRAGASQLIFYPRPDFTPAPPWALDYLIDVDADARIHARFYHFDQSYPTILYFHGNGEVASEHDNIATFYQEAGANLFVADFRGYGASTGTPTVEHLVSDAHPVAERFHVLLDHEGFSPRRFIMGRSLGSHPALELAANAPQRFEGLVIESGAAGLRRMLERFGLDIDSGPGVDLVAGHEAKIRSIRLPLLVIHGERDELIPLEHAMELYDLLSEVERDLVVIPNAGHNDLLWVGLHPYFEAIRGFIGRSEQPLATQG